MPLSGGRVPELLAVLDAEPLSEKERAAERDADVDCDTLPEAEGVRESRGDLVSRVLLDAEGDKDREPHEEGLEEGDRVLLSEEDCLAEREVVTDTVGETDVLLLLVPDTELDGDLVALALLGEIVTVAFGDFVGDSESEGLPVADISADVARGVADSQTEPLVEPVWEGLAEFEREMDGLGEEDGERVEFVDPEAIREALGDPVQEAGAEVAPGDLVDVGQNVCEGVEEAEEEGAAIVREGVEDTRIVPLNKGEPLIEGVPPSDWEADADCAVDGESDGDVVELLVSWEDCVEVALSGTRVGVAVTLAERELEDVMDGEPVMVPVAEARAVTVTVEVAERDAISEVVLETLPVRAPLPLRVAEGVTVLHVDSEGDAEKVPDLVLEALPVRAPLKEADRVEFGDAVKNDAVGDTVLDGVDVTTGCTDADFVDDGDAETPNDADGDTELPLADARGESEGPALEDTERLAPGDEEEEGEPDSVPLTDGEADAGAERVGSPFVAEPDAV